MSEVLVLCEFGYEVIRHRLEGGGSNEICEVQCPGVDDPNGDYENPAEVPRHQHPAQTTAALKNAGEIEAWGSGYSVGLRQGREDRGADLPLVESTPTYWAEPHVPYQRLVVERGDYSIWVYKPDDAGLPGSPSKPWHNLSNGARVAREYFGVADLVRLVPEQPAGIRIGGVFTPTPCDPPCGRCRPGYCRPGYCNPR